MLTSSGGRMNFGDENMIPEPTFPKVEPHVKRNEDSGESSGLGNVKLNGLHHEYKLERIAA